MLKADAWRASIGTPVKSKRAVDVHSGMPPQLQRERQTLDDFLAGIGSSMAPIPSPAAPVSHDTASVLQALLEGQAALLQGVKDLRANVVTPDQLQTFQQLQSQEMRTYVQAEFSPVHSAFSQMSSQVGLIADRMSRLEARDRGAAAMHGPNPHDSALCKIAFIGFPKEAPAEARVAAMEQFMENNFQKMQVKHIDVSLKKQWRAYKSWICGGEFEAACAVSNFNSEEAPLCTSWI